MRQNLDIAFRFMTETEKIPLVNIGENVCEHVLWMWVCVTVHVHV